MSDASDHAVVRPIRDAQTRLRLTVGAVHDWLFGGGALAASTITATAGIAAPETAGAGAVCAATIHGAQRLAERGFTPAEIASALQQTPLAQADGAKVFIDSLASGRYNVIISGENGVITSVKNISPDALARLAVSYGWSP